MQNVLIVEDLPEIRHWLGQTAQQAFPQLKNCAVSHVQEALSQIKAQAFDLGLGRFELAGW